MKIGMIKLQLVFRMVLISIALMVSSVLGFAEHLATLDKVVSPHCLRVYSGRVYLLEGGTVNVYRCADGRYIKAFGRAGEGPGNSRPAAICCG